MIKINGKPLIEHIMQHYSNYGLNEFLSKIQNKDKGSPTNITYKGSSINIDYLLSAEEILFLHIYLLIRVKLKKNTNNLH